MGKIACITGATSGIGYYSAIEFAKLGYNLIITGRRKERFENIDTALQNTFITLTEGLGAYSKSTKDYIAGLDDHLERAATHLHSVVRGLKDAVEEWQEIREDMETTNASTQEKARG